MPTRKNVFETNSSSTHSITISDQKSYMDTITPNSNGIIILEGGDFGWEWMRYNDPKQKALYCMNYAAYHDNDDMLNMLSEVIKEQTGAKMVNLKSHQKSSYTNEPEPTGSIDHQSIGTAKEAFESKKKLRLFIFSRNSWLMLGNDNDSPPQPYFYYPNKDNVNGHLVIENQWYPLDDKNDQFEIRNTIQSHYYKIFGLNVMIDLNINWENQVVDQQAWEFDKSADNGRQELPQHCKTGITFEIKNEYNGY